MYYIMSYSKLFKPYLKSNVLCGNFGTVQVKKLQDMITAEELTTFVAMQFEQRLNNLLRSFPIQDVGKEESELRKQVCSFCEAVVTEQQHPDSEFSTVSSEVATMVIDLLSIGNVVALQRGAATLNTLEPATVLQFRRGFLHEAQGRTTPYAGIGRGNGGGRRPSCC